MATVVTAESSNEGGSEKGSTKAAPGGPKGSPFALLRKIDDAVFAVEQTIVATFLSAITVMVFLDFVDRRLTAPDSRVGLLLARLFGVTDQGTVHLLEHTVAPILSSVVGLVVLFFGVAATRSPRGESSKIDGKTALITLAFAALLAGLGFLMSWKAPALDEFGFERQMRVFPSKYFYMLLYALVAVPWTVQLVRTKAEGWATRIVGLAVAGGLLAAFALHYFPDEYSWSKELSLIMLLWVGFLGASICAHEGKHIRMEAASRVVPEKIEKHVSALGFLLAAFFCGIMAWLGYEYAKTTMQYGGVYEQTGVPDWFSTIAIPIAFGLTVLRFIAAAFSSWLGGSYGASVDDDLAAAQAARLADGGADPEPEAEPEPDGEADPEPEPEDGEHDEDDDR